MKGTNLRCGLLCGGPREMAGLVVLAGNGVRGVALACGARVRAHEGERHGQGMGPRGSDTAGAMLFISISVLSL